MSIHSSPATLHLQRLQDTGDGSPIEDIYEIDVPPFGHNAYPTTPWNARPQWHHDLHQALVAADLVRPGEELLTELRARFWYLNPVRRPVWESWRPLLLAPNSDYWLNGLRAVWRDILERDEPVHIQVARPHPPRHAGQDHFQADLILGELLEPDHRTALTIVAWRSNHVHPPFHTTARILPPVVSKWELLQHGLALDRHCGGPGSFYRLPILPTMLNADLHW